MRHVAWRLGRVLGLALVLLIPAGPVAASAPAPTYAVTLSVDSSCTFTAKVSWTHAKLTEVDVTWYMSGVARDPLAVVNPVHGHSAAPTWSLYVDSAVTRDFYATAALYAGGSLVTTLTSNTLTVGCGFSL